MKIIITAILVLLGGQRCRAADTNLLLQVIYGGPYVGVIPGQYLGDASSYADRRFIVHKNIPSTYNGRGGISFNPGSNAFIAVNDGFLAGLEHFEINFWFFTAYGNPTNGTLVGSNWATTNSGDWLLQFAPSGRLTLMIQDDTLPTTFTEGITSNFLHDTEYRVKLVKDGTQMRVYVNEQLEIVTTVPQAMPENGSPLCFGANAYDRDGMQYFTGTIGGIEIRKL